MIGNALDNFGTMLGYAVFIMGCLLILKLMLKHLIFAHPLLMLIGFLFVHGAKEPGGVVTEEELLRRADSKLDEAERELALVRSTKANPASYIGRLNQATHAVGLAKKHTLPEQTAAIRNRLALLPQHKAIHSEYRTASK